MVERPDSTPATKTAGHNQPVPRADLFHVTTPMSVPNNVKRVIRELALRHAQRFR
jgi:hypothetical protein